jgi:hypothetical protein
MRLRADAERDMQQWIQRTACMPMLRTDRGRGPAGRRTYSAGLPRSGAAGRRATFCRSPAAASLPPERLCAYSDLPGRIHGGLRRVGPSESAVEQAARHDGDPSDSGGERLAKLDP